MLPLTAYSQESMPKNLFIKSTSKAFKTGSTPPKETIDIVRQGLGDCKLHYWGRIVEAQVAANLGKGVCMPIYPNENTKYPVLYIDGTPCLNHKKSDACLAWLIRPCDFLFK